MPPSFDDVPASAAPDKRVSSAMSQREFGIASLSLHDREVQTSSAAAPRSDTSFYLDNSHTPTIEKDPTMHREQQNGYTNGEDLPALQTQGNLDEFERDRLDPITEDDPASYDLVAPMASEVQKEPWSLERQSIALFSREHLQVVFSEPSYIIKFTSFLGVHRPQSVPILVHYLDTLKAIRAIHYTNAILDGLDPVPGLDFTSKKADLTRNIALEARANAAFDQLVREELPAYITHQYIQVVSASISARISGSLAPHLREASEGLAEVFCLTDPSRPDNPIVFASEEFNRTTQYGMSYVLGRNCRFLQGPETNQNSVRRIREAIKADKHHQELFLNYRRDGSPFMNLLMTAPLCDSRGVVRYNIGAQVDVSGLVKECVELQSLQHLLELKADGAKVPDPQIPDPDKNDELRELAEMLNQAEISTISKYGGRMHRDFSDDQHHTINNGGLADGEYVSSQKRLLLRDPNTMTPPFSQDFHSSISGKLSGVYQHYLLIRPYPSLRVLFASPSQRVPGILQSPFMNKIGGSQRVRDELTAALAEGRGVTAKVRWVSKHDEAGRNRWIHCTPLVGINQQIGVWMVILVDDERNRRGLGYGGRMAPPVPAAQPNDRGQSGGTYSSATTFYNPPTTGSDPQSTRGERNGVNNFDSDVGRPQGYNHPPPHPQPLASHSTQRNFDTTPRAGSRNDEFDDRSHASGSVQSFGLV